MSIDYRAAMKDFANKLNADYPDAHAHAEDMEGGVVGLYAWGEWIAELRTPRDLHINYYGEREIRGGNLQGLLGWLRPQVITDFAKGGGREEAPVFEDWQAWQFSDIQSPLSNDEMKQMSEEAQKRYREAMRHAYGDGPVKDMGRRQKHEKLMNDISAAMPPPGQAWYWLRYGKTRRGCWHWSPDGSRTASCGISLADADSDTLPYPLLGSTTCAKCSINERRPVHVNCEKCKGEGWVCVCRDNGGPSCDCVGLFPCTVPPKKEVGRKADLTPEVFNEAIKYCKSVIAQARKRWGRDFVRAHPQGLLLDALDAGLEVSHPDDVLRASVGVVAVGGVSDEAVLVSDDMIDEVFAELYATALKRVKARIRKTLKARKSS